MEYHFTITLKNTATKETKAHYYDYKNYDYLSAWDNIHEKAIAVLDIVTNYDSSEHRDKWIIQKIENA